MQPKLGASMLDRAPEVLRKAKKLIASGMTVEEASVKSGFASAAQYYYYARRFGVESPALDSEKRDAEIEEQNRRVRAGEKSAEELIEEYDKQTNGRPEESSDVPERLKELETYIKTELAGTIKALCIGVEAAATNASEKQLHITINIQEVSVYGITK